MPSPIKELRRLKAVFILDSLVVEVAVGLSPCDQLCALEPNNNVTAKLHFVICGSMPCVSSVVVLPEEPVLPVA